MIYIILTALIFLGIGFFWGSYEPIEPSKELKKIRKNTEEAKYTQEMLDRDNYCKLLPIIKSRVEEDSKKGLNKTVVYTAENIGNDEWIRINNNIEKYLIIHFRSLGFTCRYNYCHYNGNPTVIDIKW